MWGGRGKRYHWRPGKLRADLVARAFKVLGHGMSFGLFDDLAGDEITLIVNLNIPHGDNRLRLHCELFVDGDMPSHTRSVGSPTEGNQKNKEWRLLSLETTSLCNV